MALQVYYAGCSNSCLDAQLLVAIQLSQLSLSDLLAKQCARLGAWAVCIAKIRNWEAKQILDEFKQAIETIAKQ